MSKTGPLLRPMPRPLPRSHDPLPRSGEEYFDSWFITHGPIAAALLLGALAVGLDRSAGPQGLPLWFAGGIALALTLLVAPERRLSLFLAFAAAFASAQVVLGRAVTAAFAQAAIALLELGLAIVLIEHAGKARLPPVAGAAGWVRMTAIAAVCAATGVLADGALAWLAGMKITPSGLFGGPGLAAMGTRILGHGLALALAASLVLTLTGVGPRDSNRRPALLAPTAALVPSALLCTFFVWWQSNPAMLLILPALSFLVALRLGAGIALAFTVLATLAGWAMAASGHGPPAALGLSAPASLLALQSTMLATFLTATVVPAALGAAQGEREQADCTGQGPSLAGRLAEQGRSGQPPVCAGTSGDEGERAGPQAHPGEGAQRTDPSLASPTPAPGATGQADECTRTTDEAAPTVLLISADPTLLKAMDELLALCGLELRSAASIEAAHGFLLSEIEANARPELVLADLGDQDPVQARELKNLRTNTSTCQRLPLIAMGTRAPLWQGTALRHCGFDAMLDRPPRFSDLLEALDRWLPLRIVDPAQARRGMPADAPPDQPLAGRRLERSPLPLEKRWLARRDEVLEAVRLALAQGAPGCSELGTLAENLRKLAETAALFGDKELSARAAALDRALRAQVSDAVRIALARELLELD